MRRVIRIGCGRPLWALTLLLAGFASTVQAQLPLGERLLPPTTKLFVSVRSVSELLDARGKTLFGKLDDEPSMKPFFDDLKTQLERQAEEAEVKLGLKASDLKGLCDGQLTVAVVPYSPDEAGKPRTGTILLVDVTGHVPQAQQVRAKLAASLAQHKTQQSPFNTPSGAAGTLHIVPPQKEKGRTVDFVEVLQTQGASTVWLIGSPILVNEVSANLAGATGPKLADSDAFVKVMNQTAPAAGEAAAQLAVFVEPLGLSAALRAYEPHGTRHKPDGLAVLQGAGFDAVKGIGGQLAFHVGDYGVLFRVAALVPQPWQKSMNMLTFFPGADFSPQPWVADGVTGYTTLYWDMLKAFDNFGPLFDGFLEQEGIWKDVVESMEKDPDGPQINIRKDFFSLLGQRCTAVFDRTLPPTADSARYVIAFELANQTDLPRIIATMKKAFANDPSVEHSKLGDLDVYKIIATEDVPANAPNQQGVVNGQRVIVSSLLAAANGHVYFASHIDMLQKVLGPPPPQGLATAADYVAVTAELGKFLPAQNAQLTGLSFQRLDQLLQVDYELFRTGKMVGSQTFIGRMLDENFADSERPGPRPAKIDAGKLPSFDQVRKYLPPVGIIMRNTADGWQFVVLSHDKSAPAGK